MNLTSPSHLLLLLVIVLLLFGSGKVSGLMGDVAKGIKSFKKNMAEDDVSMEASADRPAGSIAAPGVLPTAPPPVTQTAPVNRA